MRRNSVPVRLIAVVATAALVLAGLSAAPAVAAGGPNLAAGRPTAASTVNQTYVASNLTDGNQGTYWESVNNAFPQWGQVDLGGSIAIDQVVLKLPTGWGARTQTLSVQGSPDGVSFGTIVSSAGYSFSGSNVVTINFSSTVTRYVRINVTANTGWPAAQLSELEVYGTSTSSGNLAQGKQMGESSHADVYGASNGNDGNQATYWESANNAFPQWIQVDLGSSVSVNKVIAKVPTGWGARNQTFSVQGSTDGSTFSDIVASASYAFNPASANAVTINFTAANTRWVRLRFTANTVWPAGQLSELEVYGPGTGDTTPPTVPGTLSYIVNGNSIILNWGASTDTGGSGLAAYDIYRNGTLATSVGFGVTTFTDTQSPSVTVSYFVRARDGAGNQSGNSNTVTRTGTSDTTPPSTPGTLSYTVNGTTINLSWGASTDSGGSGLAGYEVYRNGALATTTNATTTTFADTQPASATVSYYVRAKDGAGNVSGNSNTVTRTGTGNPPTNVNFQKSCVSTGFTFTFAEANINDGNVATYFEASGAFPQSVTCSLGANHTVTSMVLKLNPDSAWGARTQNIQVLGREQSASSFTSLVSATSYNWSPASGNTVTINVSATVADVRLVFNSNTGAPGGQVAEWEVYGTPAPNPDLTVSNVSWSPASPVENQAVTLSATVTNGGDLPTTANTTVNFYLDSTLRGSATVGPLAAGASTAVSFNAGAVTAATYTVTAKVDENKTIVEKNEANNSASGSSSLVVTPIQSADLVAVVAWSPGNPSANNTVTFTVAIRNQGNIASSSGTHGITLTLLNDQGATVTTRTGSTSGAIAAGSTTPAVNLGTWVAVNGRYTVRVVLANDSAEDPVKQPNNTSNTAFFAGRGANMPYDMYEAEDGTIGGGAQLLAANRVIGDLAGEASGRRAVTLAGTGSYVQWTTKASTNTLVTRFSIPDSAGGGGTTSTLSIYVNGVFHKNITLNSKYAWLYGAETGPGNSPGAGPRHIYDEANIMLNSTVPAGATIKLQRDSGQGIATIDFVNLEQVAQIANPDPTRYVVPAGFAHQDVQNALDTARQDATKLGVYLPAGTYPTSNKLMIYGRGIQVIGAGPWYTRFETPQSQENTNAGFDVQSSASGSTFKNLSFWGNYTSRVDGPGKVWGELKDVNNLTIDNTWVEHTIVSYWGVHSAGLRYTNGRIRNTFADGINMTSDSTGALVSNVDARGNGDDAFALFSAIDGGGSVGNHDNVFENLSATLTWRAAGLAVYGGYNNIFRNLYIADQLTYSGITISSLDFGYPFVGFGTVPTRFENITIARAGGHFWGNQVFPAIWCFSASKELRGIRVSDVDIIDPTYSGIMFQTKYTGSTPENSVTDTIFTNIRISGAVQSGDQYDAKSGIGIWANELPEAGQGPARGSATFTNLTFTNVFQNIRNTTTTFTITIT